jgi:uncharacterized OB-fold protein
MSDLVVNVDMGKRCAECGKAGATDSGICLKCAIKAIDGKPMLSRQGKVVSERLDALLRKPAGRR